MSPSAKILESFIVMHNTQERDWIGATVKFLGPFFQKKVSFLANIGCCPKFLEYPLNWENRENRENRENWENRENKENIGYRENWETEKTKKFEKNEKTENREKTEKTE